VNSTKEPKLAAQQEFFMKREQDLDMKKSMGGAIFAGAAVATTAAVVASANVKDVQPEAKPEEVAAPVETAPVEVPVEETKPTE
jgi:hypothetical protein